MIQFIFMAIIIGAQIAPESRIQNKSFLLEQLKSSSSDLKINSLQKLAQLKYLDTIPSIAALATDADPEVRFQVIQCLSRMPYQEALDAFNSQFKEEKDPYLKAELRRSSKELEDLLKAQVSAAEAAAEKTKK